jgi:patatin-related protein
MSSPQAHSEAVKPKVKFNQEIRFAVVMYGGASLAIYINGVAQELLRLVRATAPEPGGDVGDGVAHLTDAKLKGSERVYRQIGRILSRGESPADGTDATDISKGLDLPIRTRFVVDILTGTSAGGINAVYLAKALANDQNMDELKKLWVNEGDIGILINDENSYKGLEIKKQEGEPWSLLNSRRMYVKLLDALRGMDYPKRPDGDAGNLPQADNETVGTALVDDLDLYVTSTDIDGRIIQMRLADKVVSERRHRNVFHFRYRSERPEGDDLSVNDFEPEYNAFLAFAARATSAHQAAFSPVKLDDVTPVIEDYKLQDVYKPENENLRVFFRDYLLQRADEEGATVNMDQTQLADAFRSIWFNDGGSLDNKPFTFVFEELPLRQASAAVDRKLLYVEPSPEHLKWARAREKRPQIVQNAWGGLSTLPSYETIVGDLTRLLERNRLIERIRHITEDTEDDIESRYGGNWPPTLPMNELRRLRLNELISAKGTAWGGYQRLRIAQVTDDLTLLIARAAGIDEDSDEYTAIRQLVRYWRTGRYDDHDPQKEAEIGFLLDYDLQWTVRRVRFVMRKLDEISCFDKRAQKLAEQTNQPKIKITWPANQEQEEQFSRSLREIRKSLGGVLARLNAARRAFWAYGNDVVKGEQDANGNPVYLNPFRVAVYNLNITGADLRDFLALHTEAMRAEALGRYLGDPSHNDAFKSLVNDVRDRFKEEIDKSRNACRAVLREPREARQSEAEEVRQLDPAESVPYILLYYFKTFEAFDQVTFPILYSTDVGEEMDTIEVFRVSPEDAPAIINEKDEDESGKTKLKLAGTTLGHFGAFFERKFRINDIMWGRLDGAERLIAALLPTQDDLRKEFTRQAHLAIIEEEALSKLDLAWEQAKDVFVGLKDAGQGSRNDLPLYKRVEEAIGAMREAILTKRAGGDCESALSTIESEAKSLSDGSPWRSFLEAFVSEFRPFSSKFIVPRANGTDTIDAFRSWFHAQYEDGRQLTPEESRKSAVRINQVLGGMVQGYFPEEGKRDFRQKRLLWLGERIQIFIEAALQPGGDAHRKLRRRLIAAYIISLLLLVSILLLKGLWMWVALAIVFLVALIPLALTVAYNVAWHKFKNMLASFPPKL